MQETSRYASERLWILSRLRMEAGGRPLADLFRLPAETLRYRLGTSLADLRLPFAVAPDLATVLARAADEAQRLVGRRHGLAASEPAGSLSLVETTPTRPLTFSPPSTVTRDAVRRVFLDGPVLHQGLDAGVIAAFLGTGRPGRTLAGALHAVFVKAREESQRAEVDEPTPYLAALMLRRAFEQVLRGLTPATAEQTGRYVEAGSRMLLQLAAQLALREAGVWSAADDRQRSLRIPALMTLASLGAPAFLRGGTGPGVSAWGFLLETPPPLLEAVVQHLEAAEDPDAIERALLARMETDRELLRRLERAVALAAVRENLRALARLADVGRAPAVTIPGEGSVDKVAAGRDAVDRLFTSETRRRELAQVARVAARQAARQHGMEEARSRLEGLAFAAGEWREEQPAFWLGSDDARRQAAHALVAMGADLLTDRLAAAAGRALTDRTGSGTEEVEYAEGRLYRLSHGPDPLLGARLEPRQVAHLFVDVKDFTRRTAFLKESVITEFMQREFFGPILSAAADLDPGTRSTWEPRALQLNNLVGDAVSFSGDVVALVNLARRIRTTLRAYSQRLDAEASHETIAARVRSLEDRYRLRRERLERALQELGAEQVTDAASRAALRQRARDLRIEIARQQAVFQAEMARAAGEKLEAGIFISYGSAPEVASWDDPAFGRVSIAIAEKINESARGTARHTGARDRLLARLEVARRETGRMLELPFGVIIEQPSELALTPERLLEAERLQAAGNDSGARELLAAALEEALRRQTGTGELYNAGAALSDEALRAYLDARSGQFRVQQVELPVDTLHPTILERFYFPHPQLRVVACFDEALKALSELFVLQGRVRFKGMEASALSIYEMIDPQDPLFRMLATRHLRMGG